MARTDSTCRYGYTYMTGGKGGREENKVIGGADPSLTSHDILGGNNAPYPLAFFLFFFPALASARIVHLATKSLTGCPVLTIEGFLERYALSLLPLVKGSGCVVP